MHNEKKKYSVRLALVFGCLLGGVVFQAASAGSVTSGMASLVSASSSLIQGELDTGAGEDDTSLSQVSKPLPDDVAVESSGSPAYRKVLAVIKTELRQGRPTAALRLLEKDQLAASLKPAEFDRLRAQIARSYLTEGKIDKAVGLAEKAIARSGKLVPLAGWVVGQVAWREQNFDRAFDMFSLVGRSPVASDWFQSAGAFWAARSAVRIGRSDEAKKWLEKAAEHSRTFYGLIALRALDRDFAFNWEPPVVNRAEKHKLDAAASVQDALKLAQGGKVSAAIHKLDESGWMAERVKRERLLAYLMDKKTPSLVLYLARKTKNAEGKFFDAALYPLSPWQPKTGYEVDQALVLALVRQESRFNPHAVSSTGAKGLMQLLPSTARDMSSSEEESLSNPDVNLAVGQKYVRHLLKDPAVGNDLFKMAAAYNAGPGNLARWQRNASESAKDPLLFLESIPAAETRAFVERVMVNYWIYSIRMGKDIPSLEAVASRDETVVASSGRAHAGLIEIASSR